MNSGLRSTLQILFGLGMLGLMGCHNHQVADLGGIYSEAIQNYASQQNPVIVIPGVLGSRLVDPESGKVIWGAFDRKAANPSTAEGAGFNALPMREGASLAELTDSIIPDGALRKLKFNIFGLPIELRAYANIMATLGVGGYLDPAVVYNSGLIYEEAHYTCFQFDYDWRRSNVENAKKLNLFIQERSEIIQTERIKNGDSRPVKFNLVAHSMGGLVARYYLRYGDAPLPEDGSLPELNWAGAKHINNLILIGTPNAGSILTLERLANGLNLKPVVSLPSSVLGTYPSLYELLPRTRHGGLVDAANTDKQLDPMSPALWQQLEWGLADPEQAKVLRWLLPDESSDTTRRRIALDHQQKCLENARRFHAAMDRPAIPPDGVQINLVAGDSEPTMKTYQVKITTGKLKPFQYGPGDGTVLRKSALMDERMGRPWTSGLDSPIAWDHVTFLFENHLGLTRSPVFADNLLFQLLEQPPHK